MKNKVRLLISEAQNKMSGYTMLLSFQFMNLCIKAEPVSLLSVSIPEEERSRNLEDVADVILANEYQFVVVPKDSDMMLAIGKAIFEAHPEFKQEEVSEQTDEQEEADNSRPDKPSIRCTMPQVDKSRYDLCHKYVKKLSDEAKTNLDLTHLDYSTQITHEMADESPEEVDRAKEEVKKSYDKLMETCKGYQEEKVKEIEEGYKRYLEGEAAANETEGGKANDADGAGFRMRMGDSD